jgi:hypothetical protein
MSLDVSINNPHHLSGFQVRFFEKTTKMLTWHLLNDQKCTHLLQIIPVLGGTCTSPTKNAPEVDKKPPNAFFRHITKNSTISLTVFHRDETREAAF